MKSFYIRFCTYLLHGSHVTLVIQFLGIESFSASDENQTSCCLVDRWNIRINMILICSSQFHSNHLSTLGCSLLPWQCHLLTITWFTYHPFHYPVLPALLSPVLPSSPLLSSPLLSSPLLSSSLVPSPLVPSALLLDCLPLDYLNGCQLFQCSFALFTISHSCLMIYEDSSLNGKWAMSDTRNEPDSEEPGILDLLGIQLTVTHPMPLFEELFSSLFSPRVLVSPGVVSFEPFRFRKAWNLHYEVHPVNHQSTV